MSEWQRRDPVGEDLPDHGGDEGNQTFATLRLKWARQRLQVEPTTRVMAVFGPSGATEITSFTPLSPRRTGSDGKVEQHDRRLIASSVAWAEVFGSDRVGFRIGNEGFDR